MSKRKTDLSLISTWPVQFLNRMAPLKKLRRTGWIVRGVPDPESIAAHCFRVNLMCMILGDEANRQGRGLSMERLLRIATVHEIGEASIGDLHLEARNYIGDAVSVGERRAVEDMLKDSPDRDIYWQAWLDFEERRNPEGRFVRGIDKLEMILTAYEYESFGITGLNEFFVQPNTRDILNDTLLSQILDQILGMRIGIVAGAAAEPPQPSSG